jgi:hypothetical protein
MTSSKAVLGQSIQILAEKEAPRDLKPPLAARGQVAAAGLAICSRNVCVGLTIVAQ